MTLLIVAISDLLYWLVSMAQNYSCNVVSDLRYPATKIASASLVFIIILCFICLLVDFAYKTPVFLWPYRLFLVSSPFPAAHTHHL